MSLATFKKKSINSASSATKISGKATNNYWIYQGPYGRKGNLPSAIFNASLVGPDGMVGGNYNNASNAGFSISHRINNINCSLIEFGFTLTFFFFSINSTIFLVI